MPSADPDQLICKHFTAQRCRSCSLLALADAERASGKERALHALTREKLGTGFEIAPLWTPRTIFPSRTKAKLSVSGTVDRPCIGLVDNSFAGIDLPDCPLHVPSIEAAIREIRPLISEFRLFPYDIEKRSGELKALILKADAVTGKLIVRFVLRSTEAVPRVRKAVAVLQQRLPQVAVASINLQPIPHAILEGPEELPLTEQQILWERYGSVELAFAPQCFSQVTYETAVALYAHVRKLFMEIPAHHVLDLYCGVGGFSLHAADLVQTVHGIELSAQAIACAELGAERRGMRNTAFISADAEQFLQEYRGPVPDAVILNPPRRGLSPGIIDRVSALRPERIIYSSCNPETLVRDLQLLSGSYRVGGLAPFDMFPLTPHLEVAAVLSKL